MQEWRSQGSEIIAGHIFYRNEKFAAVQDMYGVEDEVVNSLIADPNMFPSSQLGKSEMAVLKKVIYFVNMNCPRHFLLSDIVSLLT